METLLQLLLSGVLLGGVYALAAMGLNLIFGVAKVVNFAHGEFLMAGMYAAFGLWTLLRVNPYVGAPITFALGALLGALFYRGLIRHTIARTEMTQVFATLGVSIAAQNVALLLFSADYRSIKFLPASRESVHLLGLYVSTTRLVSFGFAALVIAGVMLFIRRTDTGKAIEAVSQDLSAARLVGIDVDRVLLIACALGIGLTVMAGAVLLPTFYAFPTVGSSFVLVSFVVVVMGGLGNVAGTAAGGLLLGVIESVFGFFQPDLKEASHFILLIALLAFVPHGLFGVKGSEREALK
jgi:branched-chain amino acid transport system permease protein